MKDRKVKQVLSRVGAHGRRALGKGGGGQIWWKCYAFMYENGTMRLVQTYKKGEKGDKGE
jgi:hypothetical protein